jgi:hypothetical protein
MMGEKLYSNDKSLMSCLAEKEEKKYYIERNIFLLLLLSDIKVKGKK